MSLRSESFETYVASLGSGEVYVVGPNGDTDPGHALEDIVISNTGATAIRVASSLTGVQGARFLLINTGTPPVTIKGPRDALIIKTNTAAASTFSVTAEAYYRNSARDGGAKGAKGDPGVLTRYRSGRLGFTANTADVTTTARFKGSPTISAIKLYAGTAPTGATITVTVSDLQGRNLLSAASFDLETLVGGTLTSLTLTSSTDLLALGRGGGVVFKVTSTGGGDTCSVAFEIVYEGE